MRVAPHIISGLGGVMLGLAGAVAASATADPGTPGVTPPVQQESPWNAAGGMTAGAALLIAVGRLSAGGLTLTVKLDDADADRLETLRCMHPGTPPRTRNSKDCP